MEHIEIAEGIAIGANSYVNKSFMEPELLLQVVQRRKYQTKALRDCWFRATEILRKEDEEANIDEPE